MGSTAVRGLHQPQRRGLVQSESFREVRMLTKLLVSVVFIVSSVYAGTCGEINGTVRCTDDVGQNSTLQNLDKSVLNPSDGGALADSSSIRNEMATYPPDLKLQGGWREPSASKPDQEQENKTTFQSWGPARSRP